MDKNKVLSMLGLARRAGKLAMGRDAAAQSIVAGKAFMLVFCSDVSPRLVSEFSVTIAKHSPQLKGFQVPINMDEIKKMLGYRAGVFTVTDSNFAKRITELINQEEIEW